VPPPPLRGARSLHRETRSWWEGWRSRGLELGFIGTDWQRLEMLVLFPDLTPETGSTTRFLTNATGTEPGGHRWKETLLRLVSQIQAAWRR
jgi:hypothetical protein